MKKSTPKQASARKSALSLVRLQLIMPFVNELDRLNLNVNALLQQHGLVRASVEDANLFIPSNIIHRFLEDAAAAADDPYLGARVGEQLDFTRWSPVIDAVAQSSSFGDFLTRFILAASEDTSSATHSLELKGAHTFFREHRTSEPDITPSQNDAFTAAYLLNILQSAVGELWKPQAVLLQVCTPEVLPAGYHGVQVVGGDNRGMLIRFPTEWLTQPVEPRGFSAVSPVSSEKIYPPGSFLEALWLALSPRLGREDLTVDNVAHLLGLSRQRLQRRLKASNTSLTQELAAMKRQYATEELLHTDDPIAEIGEALGFHSPASFTRAFKSWTGQSPRNYRNTNAGQKV
jgi:AraC-like DNA-binding protein